jgi:hypothetical protein
MKAPGSRYRRERLGGGQLMVEAARRRPGGSLLPYFRKAGHVVGEAVAAHVEGADPTLLRDSAKAACAGFLAR